MTKVITFLLCTTVLGKVWSQNIAINTDGSQPHASAILDIKNANKGLLIPRVNLLNDTDANTIASPAYSLLVFNNNATLPDGQGYYFWHGNIWRKLATINNLTNLAWGINGNGNTNANSDFIGTTDNTPLIFKTNNILSGKIDPGNKGVFFGQNAGLVTTGFFNSFFGEESGYRNTSGNQNSALGYYALRSNTTGHDNSVVGINALGSNTTGAFNSAIGVFALNGNTTGDLNSAVGSYSLELNTTGFHNTAVGGYAMRNNSTGYSNSTLGYNSMQKNTTGNSNSAFGNSSMFYNTTGYSNSAFGYISLENNTTGYYNAAFGQAALHDNTNGDRNAAFGVDAMRNNVSGYQNTACGNSALSQNLTGDFNTAIGYLSGPATTSLNNTTAVGYDANVITSNTMVFGNGNVDRWAFGLSTTNASHALEVGNTFGNGNGAYLTQGGVWTNASDVNKKEAFTDVNSTELLQKISQLNIQRWKYKGTNEYHIGPTAQDFHKTFNVGTDDVGISTIDPSGIALLAIKEQQKIIQSLQNELKEIRELLQAKK